jgi:hypothetical protein
MGRRKPMKILYPGSLAETIDALSDAFFYGKALTKEQKEEVAKWIAGRVGMRRSYAEMPSPTDSDFEGGITLFTGDKVRTGGGTAHILGEESCRALLLLNVKKPVIKNALAAATDGMLSKLDPGKNQGTYCCGVCSVSFWRHLLAGGLDKNERRLEAGIRALNRHRKNNGQWRRFPFHYTILALSEMDFPEALSELKYAAPVLEGIAKRAPRGEYGKRRQDLAIRALDKL